MFSNDIEQLDVACLALSKYIAAHTEQPGLTNAQARAVVNASRVAIKTANGIGTDLVLEVIDLLGQGSKDLATTRPRTYAQT